MEHGIMLLSILVFRTCLKYMGLGFIPLSLIKVLGSTPRHLVGSLALLHLSS